MHHETQQMPIYELVLARKDGTLGPPLRPTTIDCRVDRPRCTIQGGVGRFAKHAILLKTLVSVLSYNAQRVVVDHTGLEGQFDVELEWMPDNLPAQGADSTPVQSDKPFLFTALQEQLGLKLESTTASVDAIVIDHIEEPTPD
jgi:uncharacterized protein (TIGR03435 family)